MCDCSDSEVHPLLRPTSLTVFGFYGSSPSSLLHTYRHKFCVLAKDDRQHDGNFPTEPPYSFSST